MPTTRFYSVAHFGGGAAAVELLAGKLRDDVAQVCPIIGINVIIPDNGQFPFVASPVFASGATSGQMIVANALCASWTGQANATEIAMLGPGNGGGLPPGQIFIQPFPPNDALGADGDEWFDQHTANLYRKQNGTFF